MLVSDELSIYKIFWEKLKFKETNCKGKNVMLFCVFLSFFRLCLLFLLYVLGRLKSSNTSLCGVISIDGQADRHIAFWRTCTAFYHLEIMCEQKLLEMTVSQFWQLVGMGSCNISNIGSLEKMCPIFCKTPKYTPKHTMHCSFQLKLTIVAVKCHQL